MHRELSILIDEGMSSYKNPTGIGLHALNLYKHLSKITNCSITNYSLMRFIPKGIRKFSIDIYINILHPYRKYDIVHYQNNYVPFTKGNNKKVVTIHDLGAFFYPETIPFIYVEYIKHSIKQAVKRADAIITPSNSVKDEILNMFSNAKNVYVCYDGIREIFFEKTDDSLHKYNLKPYSYFFFLGSLSKRKNLSFLLNAFLYAKKQNLIAKDTLLVLGGYKWWGASEFEKLINKNRDIITLGYIDEKDIPAIYKYSKAFIFPSIYEGFGMPIVEAMSQGVPIIISNISTSIELNNRHNNKMFVFELGNLDSLVEILKYLDKNYEKLRKEIDYGDLSIYNYDNIAKAHLKIYQNLI